MRKQFSKQQAAQEVFLVFSRCGLKPEIIPPFKIIIPTLILTFGNVRIFSTMGKEILVPEKQNRTLYEKLVEHLENEEGEVSLNQTLNRIYEVKEQQAIEILRQQHSNQIRNKRGTKSTMISHSEKGSNNTSYKEFEYELKHRVWNFRICIIGDEIASWDNVMKFKKKSIKIDTIGNNKRLQQISFTTEAIYRPLTTPEQLMQMFLTVFSLSSEGRKKFNLSTSQLSGGKYPNQKHSVEFSVDCVCCKPSKELSNDLFLCSQCLGVHCSRNQFQNCQQCGTAFEKLGIENMPY